MATVQPRKRLKIKNLDNSVNVIGVAFYQNECSRILGSVGALIFFAYITLRSTYSYQHLKGWAHQLQLANGNLKVKFRQPKEKLTSKPNHKLKIEKLHIPFWGRVSPFLFIFPKNEDKDVEGLDYRVLNAQVEGMAENGMAWHANVVFIYEAKTNTLLHHCLAVDGSPYSLFEQLLLLIDNADAVVCKKLNATEYLKLEKRLWLPTGLTETNQASSAYAQVFDFFKNLNLVEHQKTSGNVNYLDGMFQELDPERKSSREVNIREAIAKAKIENKFDDSDVCGYPDSNFTYQVCAKPKAASIDGTPAPSLPVKKLGYIINDDNDLANAIERLMCGVVMAYNEEQKSKEKQKIESSEIKQEKIKIYTDWVDLNSVNKGEKTMVIRK